MKFLANPIPVSAYIYKKKRENNKPGLGVRSGVEGILKVVTLN